MTFRRGGTYAHVEFSVDVVVDNEVVHHSHPVRLHWVLPFACKTLSAISLFMKIHLRTGNCRHRCGKNSLPGGGSFCCNADAAKENGRHTKLEAAERRFGPQSEANLKWLDHYAYISSCPDCLM